MLRLLTIRSVPTRNKLVANRSGGFKTMVFDALFIKRLEILKE